MNYTPILLLIGIISFGLIFSVNHHFDGICKVVLKNKDSFHKNDVKFCEEN